MIRSLSTSALGQPSETNPTRGAAPAFAALRRTFGDGLVTLGFLAIWAAYLYGKFFLPPANPDTAAGKVMLAATPFYLHPFVWSVAVIAAALAALIWWRTKK